MLFFWRQWFMESARMPPLEPVDTAGRLSWTNHIAQEELCHLARFAVSLAVHWHAKQIKAVSQKSQRLSDPKWPKHCKLIKRLYGLTLYAILSSLACAFNIFQHSKQQEPCLALSLAPHMHFNFLLHFLLLFLLLFLANAVEKSMKLPSTTSLRSWACIEA